MIIGEGFPTLTMPYQFVVVYTDSVGNFISRFDFGDNTKSDAIFSAVPTADKGWIFTGYSNSYQAGPVSLFVLKMDSNQQIINPQTFGSTGIDIGYQIINDEVNGGYLIAGSSNNGTDDDFILVKINVNQYPNSIISIDNKEQIAIYPNPSNGLINLPKSLDVLSFSIFDVTGRMLKTIPIVGNQIDLTDLPNGNYLVRFTSDKSTHYTKITIAR
jgi:hypothetical protein